MFQHSADKADFGDRSVRNLHSNLLEQSAGMWHDATFAVRVCTKCCGCPQFHGIVRPKKIQKTDGCGRSAAQAVGKICTTLWRPNRSAKCARCCDEKTARKPKSLKHRGLGTFFEVQQSFLVAARYHCVASAQACHQRSHVDTPGVGKGSTTTVFLRQAHNFVVYWVDV